MSPTLKKPITSERLKAKELAVLTKTMESGSRPLLEKFRLIEKSSKSKDLSFIDVLSLVRTALKAQNSGKRYPVLVSALTAVHKNIVNKTTTPVLSSNGDYVAMGDGLKWATRNIGASKPEDSGDYFAWGETEPKYTSLSPLIWKESAARGYWTETYKFNSKKEESASSYAASKYNEADGKTVLEPVDDVARVTLKGNWRIPTEAEWKRLLDKNNFTWTLVNQGKVQGYIVTSKVKGYEGNKIFLPAASDFMNQTLRFKGDLLRGSYWSSSSVLKNNQMRARYLCFTDSFNDVCNGIRCMGLSIRPVSL